MLFILIKEEGDKTVLLTEKELKTLYPKTYSYFISNKEKLLERKDSRSKVDEKKWYGIVRFGTYSIFKQPKIITPGEVSNNKFSLDITGSGFSFARVYAVTITDKTFDIYFLLGLLNSNLIEYYLHSVAPVKAGGYFQYSAEILDTIPLPKNIDEKTKDVEKITALVHKLMQDEKEEEKRLKIEKSIDQLVYKLYELSNNEISLIENSSI